MNHVILVNSLCKRRRFWPQTNVDSSNLAPPSSKQQPVPGALPLATAGSADSWFKTQSLSNQSSRGASYLLREVSICLPLLAQHSCLCAMNYASTNQFVEGQDVLRVGGIHCPCLTSSHTASMATRVAQQVASLLAVFVFGWVVWGFCSSVWFATCIVTPS